MSAWVLSSRSFARKVKGPSFAAEVLAIQCPECGHSIHHRSNEAQQWPGLPAGVKFDPSDKELLEHLAAKAGQGRLPPHPFIDEFIPTLDGESGICYTHPENLPGVRYDGSPMHYFYTPIRAYTKGTRKRRRIQPGVDVGSRVEMRWHKTGKTRAIVENGKHLGCKKILVLYLSTEKGAKAEKTNWVMHQYHLGAQEEEREGEVVASKVFYQTQPRHIGVGHKADECLEQTEMEADDEPSQVLPQTSNTEITASSNSRGVPTTPVIPAPPRPRKGIFETVLEEVERMNATLNETSLCKSWIVQSALTTHTNSILSNNMDQIKNQEPAHTSLHRSLNYEDKQDVGKAFSKEAISKKETCSSQPWSSKGDSICKYGSARTSSHDLHSDAANISITLDDVQETEVPNRSVPAIESILLDTPPDIFLDSLINSQDTLDWLGKIKFSDSQETMDWLGKRKFSDSQHGCNVDDVSAAESLLESQVGS